MNKKRIRSMNWDKEEKQLLRLILKEYLAIIENKSSDTNTNKRKNEAWEEVHRKFNELNDRSRQLTQLKIQWKSMKIKARRSYNTKDTNDTVIEVQDLLTPAEQLLREHNIFDSDCIILSTSANNVGLETTSGTCAVKLQDSGPMTNIIIENNDTIVENKLKSAIQNIETKDIYEQTNKLIPKPVIPQDATNVSTPRKNDRSPMFVKTNKIKRKMLNNTETGLKSRKDHYNYLNSMMRRRKRLEVMEQKRKMDMAEQEHTIKMAIHKEKLKCAILEREILQFKKLREANIYHQ